MFESSAKVYGAGIDSVWADPCRWFGGQHPNSVEAGVVGYLVHDGVVLDHRQAAIRIVVDRSLVRRSVVV